MGRKSKTVSVANPDTLISAGFQSVDGGWYSPNDTNYEHFLSNDEAFAMYTRNADDSPVSKRKKSENRASPMLVATVRKICQFYSVDFEKRGVWGASEISLKKVINAVTTAYASVNAVDSSVIIPSEAMIKNAINSLKRNGEIVGTKKGWFCAGEQSNVDWSTFIL